MRWESYCKQFRGCTESLHLLWNVGPAEPTALPRAYTWSCIALWWVFLVVPFNVWRNAKDTPQCEWELVFQQRICPCYNLTFSIFERSAWVLWHRFRVMGKPAWPARADPMSWSVALSPQPGFTRVQTSAFWEKKINRRSRRLRIGKSWHALWGHYHFFSLVYLLLHHAWRLQAI